MKIFLDTANIEEIKEVKGYGILDGVTTNPSLIAKEKRDFKNTIKEICEIVKGPVSAEVISTDAAGMIKEAEELIKISEHVVVKIPCTFEGLKATSYLKSNNIDVNMTLVFSATQALLGCKSGARYISPFVGRLDDIGAKGIQLAVQCQDMVDMYGFETEVIAASVRHPEHAIACIESGIDIATIPHKIIMQMMKHPLTDIGLANFLSDWEKVSKK